MDDCIEYEYELTTLVNLLSIKVAEAAVILVGLFKAGKKNEKVMQLTQFEVGTCRSNFNKSMLKSPAMYVY